jgi:hypothetical protein
LKQYATSGLFLSLFCFKPQYLPVLLLIFFWAKYYQVIKGLILGIFTFFLLSVLVNGLSGLETYVHLILNISSYSHTYRVNPTHQGNIWSFVHFILPNGNNSVMIFLNALLLSFFAIAFFFAWKKINIEHQKNVFLSESIVLLLITSIHTNPYDLILTIIPISFIFILLYRKQNIFKQFTLFSHLPHFSRLFVWMTFCLLYIFCYLVLDIPELLIIPFAGFLIYQCSRRYVKQSSMYYRKIKTIVLRE